MQFHILDKNVSPPNSGQNSIYLQIDHWNDYSFVTMFYMWLHDSKGVFHDIGNIKIGFVGQDESISTYSILSRNFQFLDEQYFSVGTDVEYYQNIMRIQDDDFIVNLLRSLRDLAYSPEYIENIVDERVFNTSLLRGVSLSTVKQQFRRVLNGEAALSNYDFRYLRPQEDQFAGIELDFSVEAGSTPNTNIHAIIGRNGVGKTTLLNEMIQAITDKENTPTNFYDISSPFSTAINDDYFSRLVSVSFSAFDPFKPPQENPEPSKGTVYKYIGLKDLNGTSSTLKTHEELCQEFTKSFKLCFSEEAKQKRWLSAILTLASDDNFADMELQQLADFQNDSNLALRYMRRMSSGHAIVLLTLTQLVASVDEKTLVIIDEPESHLHPPLLSAFLRALSELLHNRNGVAIVATHSPVVLQEIPKSCVWKLTRSRLSLSASRPDIETFGENVGILTREVFGLEVIRSGYHKLLHDEVDKGLSYEEIITNYRGQLGIEAKGILKALIANREEDAVI